MSKAHALKRNISNGQADDMTGHQANHTPLGGLAGLRPASDLDDGGTYDSVAEDLLAPRHTISAPAVSPVVAMPSSTLADDVVVGEQPVPRIAIHSFCERPETAGLLQQSASDRRLAKAHVTVKMGGMQAAVDYYSQHPTPELIIVESMQSGRLLLDQVEALAGVCESGVKVIVVGAVNDIQLYRELMKQGVSEYLVPPFGALHVIRAISNLFVNPETPYLGRTIACIGAKGGVGASTIAHNLAWSISELLQSNATLVDLDLSFGTTSLDFNQDPSQGVADALTNPDRLDQVLLERLLTKCTDRLSLFTAPGTLDQEYDIEPETYEMVIQQVRGTVPYVVLDLPHIWSKWVKQTILNADDVVIVAEPDLASLRNAKNLIDLVRAARPNDAPPQIVLNQMGVVNRPEISVKDFADALGLEPVLVLPYDPKLFGSAANNGQMIFEVNAKSKAAEGISHLATSLTKREAVAPTKPKKGLLPFIKR
jgi:pilus assembly protein CpaE